MGKKLKGRLSGKQLLSILILPGFSLFYITSLTEISGVYLQLYGMELLTANIAAVLLMNVYFFYLLSHLIRSRRLEESWRFISGKMSSATIIMRSWTGNTGSPGR